MPDKKPSVPSPGDPKPAPVIDPSKEKHPTAPEIDPNPNKVPEIDPQPNKPEVQLPPDPEGHEENKLN
jgi:hypothetical protein